MIMIIIFMNWVNIFEIILKIIFILRIKIQQKPEDSGDRNFTNSDRHKHHCLQRFAYL